MDGESGESSEGEDVGAGKGIKSETERLLHTKFHPTGARMGA